MSVMKSNARWLTIDLQYTWPRLMAASAWPCLGTRTCPLEATQGLRPSQT